MKKFTILLFLMSLSFACSNDDDKVNETPCTTNVVQGLEVLITNAQNLPVTTGIMVTASDGDYVEQLQLDPTSNVYMGAFERAGTYVITVTGVDYLPYTSESVKVEADRCHVVTQKVEVQVQSI
jgi:hypothetical protein